MNIKAKKHVYRKGRKQYKDKSNSPDLHCFQFLVRINELRRNEVGFILEDGSKIVNVYRNGLLSSLILTESTEIEKVPLLSCNSIIFVCFSSAVSAKSTIFVSFLQLFSSCS